VITSFAFVALLAAAATGGCVFLYTATAELNARVDDLQVELDYAVSDLVELREEAAASLSDDDLLGAVNGLDVQVDALDRDLVALQDQVGADDYGIPVMGRVRDLESEVSSQRTAISTLDVNRQSLSTRVGGVERDISDVCQTLAFNTDLPIYC